LSKDNLEGSNLGELLNASVVAQVVKVLKILIENFIGLSLTKIFFQILNSSIVFGRPIDFGGNHMKCLMYDSERLILRKQHFVILLFVTLISMESTILDLLKIFG
jgi:hypothetical protein